MNRLPRKIFTVEWRLQQLRDVSTAEWRLNCMTSKWFHQECFLSQCVRCRHWGSTRNSETGTCSPGECSVLIGRSGDSLQTYENDRCSWSHKIFARFLAWCSFYRENRGQAIVALDWKLGAFWRGACCWLPVVPPIPPVMFVLEDSGTSAWKLLRKWNVLSSRRDRFPVNSWLNVRRQLSGCSHRIALMCRPKTLLVT